jgi:hypothetical protein
MYPNANDRRRVRRRTPKIAWASDINLIPSGTRDGSGGMSAMNNSTATGASTASLRMVFIILAPTGVSG